jgi:hypothetical protein
VQALIFLNFTQVYLRIQMGNIALDRACPAEAANHFTAAVNTGTFLSKSAIDSRYEEFVMVVRDFCDGKYTSNAEYVFCAALRV